MSAVDRPTNTEWDLGVIGAAVKNGEMSPQEAEAEAQRCALRSGTHPNTAPRPDRSATRLQVPR